MNRYRHEGELLERYLNNIERQNQILTNILETINRQNLASRNLINSYINPFAPRYRDTNFNRNWNNTLSGSTPDILSNRNSRLFSNRYSHRNSNRNINRNNRARNSINRGRTTRLNTQTTQTATNTQPNIFLQTILSMLSPVRISPSQQQIEAATETYTYNSSESRNCPIDREPINRGDSVIRIRHCGHIFRRDNLRTWFEHNPRCPMCRYDIRNYVSNDISNNSIPIPSPPPPPPPVSSIPIPSPPSPPPVEIQGESSTDTTLPPPPDIPPPTHNSDTQVINDVSFNDLANLFNAFTGNTNIEGTTENFFSTLIQNMPLNELNNLSSINLDISGNTASLSFEGNIPPPSQDDVD